MYFISVYLCLKLSFYPPVPVKHFRVSSFIKHKMELEWNPLTPFLCNDSGTVCDGEIRIFREGLRRYGEIKSDW
jgi:hypothetical protein